MKHVRFLIIVMLFWFSQYVFIPFFTIYLADLGVVPTLIGMITGTYGFSQLVVRIPFGVTADRYQNHRMFMGIGFVSLILAGGILLIAEHPILFFLARFLAGVSASTWVSFTVYFTGISDSAGKAIGVIMAANNGGVLLSYLLGYFAFEALGIQRMFIISIVSAGVGILLLLTEREEGTAKAEVKKVDLSAVGQVLRDRDLRLFSLLAALSQLIAFATAVSFTANYARTIGADGRVLSMISILFNAAGIAGSYWTGTRPYRRISEKVHSALAFVLLAVYCFGVPFCTKIGVLYALQAAGGLGRAILLANTMALSGRNIQPEHRATAMGVYQSIYGIGMTLGPVLMGAILGGTNYNYRLAFFVIGGIALLSAAASGVLIRDNRGEAVPE